MSAQLRESLTEWTDFDVAEDAVGRCLGIVPDDSFDESGTWRTDRKGIYWSANVVGDGLSRILHLLVAMGAVEMDDDCRYRWRKSFKLEEASR